MQSLSNCPICDSTNLVEALQVTDYSISKESFTLHHCNSCDFLFTNPRPNGEELSKYYESEEYISHSKTKKGIVNSLYHLVQNRNLKHKYNSFIKYVSRGTFLDYGAGAGDFVQYLKTRGLEAIGVEPSKIGRETASKKGIQLLDVNALQSITTQSLSAITLWHVLEHVEELNDTLNSLSTKLKSGGLMVIAVPNIRSFDSHFYKTKWAALDVPRHLYHFSESNVIQLLNKHGLNHIKTVGQPYDSFYVSMLSEKYNGRGTFLSLFFGLIIGAMSNFNTLFKSSSYSSQIYLFEKKAH